MTCKKCKIDLIYDNNDYEVSFCESCKAIKIKSKSLWHIVKIKISEIEDLKRLNYTMNFIIFDYMSKLYNVKADNYFIDICNYLESWLDENTSN